MGNKELTYGDPRVSKAQGGLGCEAKNVQNPEEVELRIEPDWEHYMVSGQRASSEQVDSSAGQGRTREEEKLRLLASVFHASNCSNRTFSKTSHNAYVSFILSSAYKCLQVLARFSSSAA